MLKFITMMVELLKQQMKVIVQLKQNHLVDFEIINYKGGTIEGADRHAVILNNLKISILLIMEQ